MAKPDKNTKKNLLATIIRKKLEVSKNVVRQPPPTPKDSTDGNRKN